MGSRRRGGGSWPRDTPPTPGGARHTESEEQRPGGGLAETARVRAVLEAIQRSLMPPRLCPAGRAKTAALPARRLAGLWPLWPVLLSRNELACCTPRPPP